MKKGGYNERYGDGWLAAVKKVLPGGKHKKVDIRGMMDHVIEESKRAYAGTDMEDRFVIFHDGLSLRWTPGRRSTWPREASSTVRCGSWRAT